MNISICHNLITTFQLSLLSSHSSASSAYSASELREQKSPLVAHLSTHWLLKVKQLHKSSSAEPYSSAVMSPCIRLTSSPSAAVSANGSFSSSVTPLEMALQCLKITDDFMCSHAT